MATHELHFEDGVLEFNQDVEWITSDLPEPNPNWRSTDSNGHEHHAVEESERVAYPTLTLVAGEPYWCQDCQDEHTDTWWECSVCGEKVTPGTRPSTPKPVTRGQQYYWNGEPISTERANEIMQRQHQAEIEARRLTARPPIGRRVHLASDPRTGRDGDPPPPGRRPAPPRCPGPGSWRDASAVPAAPGRRAGLPVAGGVSAPPEEDTVRAWLAHCIQAATTANLQRLAEELERQAPHPGLRSSRDLPTPEELPAVLARIDNGWQRRGEPEFGHRRHAA